MHRPPPHSDLTSAPPPLPRPRTSAALLPPLIACGFAAGLLGVARIYDSLPLHPPPCGLRRLTGLPCLGCGGTRAMKALAQGDWPAAIAFNPLVIAGVVGVFLWLLVAGLRHTAFPQSHPWPRPSSRVLAVAITALVLANWAYLVVWLPE